jgi:Mg/Co/Ni transporter MgtE
MSFMERHTNFSSHLRMREAARRIETALYVATLTGLAIGTFAGACVVAWGRR